MKNYKLVYSILILTGYSNIDNELKPCFVANKRKYMHMVYEGDKQTRFIYDKL